MNKLAYAAKLANEMDLWPVCLGDLLHQAEDNNLAMISRLIEVLRMFDRTLLCAVGNHDLTETELTRGTTLELLEQAGALKTMKNNGPYAFIEMVDGAGEKKRVLLGSTPYGKTIPNSLAAWTGLVKAADHETTKKAIGVDAGVWITHEDLAFDHRYPGARETHPMAGVDVVVNGHMHLNQKPVRRGNTAWYNPGNISRLTIDLADQIPRVWAWRLDGRTMKASDGLDVPLLEPLDLPHQSSEEVLSRKGRAVKNALLEGMAAIIEDVKEDESLPATGIASSKFVEKLRDDESQRRTDDGVFLSQIVESTLASKNAPEHISSIVERLLKKALEGNGG